MSPLFRKKEPPHETRNLSGQRLKVAIAAKNLAIEVVGGARKLADVLDIHHSTVCSWDVIPELYVYLVEDASGVGLEYLRPDLLPPGKTSRIT